MLFHHTAQAMSEQDQLRRAQRWSEELPVESKAAADTLGALSPEVQDRVMQAANIGRTINIHKVGPLGRRLSYALHACTELGLGDVSRHNLVMTEPACTRTGTFSRTS